jgi:hypothetical protein
MITQVFKTNASLWFLVCGFWFFNFSTHHISPTSKVLENQ